MYLYFFRFIMENSDNNDDETDKHAAADTSDKNTVCKQQKETLGRNQKRNHNVLSRIDSDLN